MNWHFVNKLLLWKMNLAGSTKFKIIRGAAGFAILIVPYILQKPLPRRHPLPIERGATRFGLTSWCRTTHHCMSIGSHLLYIAVTKCEVHNAVCVFVISKS
jgi:hypothetical protein